MPTTITRASILSPNVAASRILVCLDGSPFSEVSLPHAVGMAKTFDAALTLVYVMQATRSTSNDALGWEIARQEARAYLEGIEKRLQPIVQRPIELRLEQGRPAMRIVDLANEIGAELIMLASRGKGAAPIGTLGGTVQHVLALAQHSVFIAHPSAAGAATNASASASPKRILIPLDGSVRTESVLPAAARLAVINGAEILLAHVVQDPLPSALLEAPGNMELATKLALRLEASARTYLEQLRQRMSDEVKAVRTLVVRNAKPYQCLLEISQSERSDLIMLSAHGLAVDASRSFGNVTAYLLTHSTIPLLALQDLPDRELRRARGSGNDGDSQLSAPLMRADVASENV